MSAEDTSDSRPVPTLPGYEVTALRNSTSSSDVWEATQISLDRPVTIATLRPELLADPVAPAHFDELSRAFARLHHRNFVQVIDIGRSPDGIPFAVMENLDGPRLSDVLQEGGPLPPDRAVRLFLQLADALDSAWKQCGFVHRNLKPANLIVLAGDVLKISSFQSATLVRPGQDPLAGDGGMLVGTPSYMPPEQIEAAHTIDFHADMYASGAVLYQMLVGAAPFDDATDAMQVLELQKTGTLPAPSDLNPAIPAGISHVLLRLMAKRPSERYPYWQDAVEDLQRILSGRDPFLPEAWTPPASTIAPATPRPAAAAAAPAAKGRARIVVGKGAAPAPAAKPRITFGGRPAAAAAAPAAAPAPAAKPRIVIGAGAAAPSADGGTRRSAPVAAPASPLVAAPPAAAPVPESAGSRAARTAKGALAIVLSRPPPLLVRIAGFAAVAAFLVGVAYWRVRTLEDKAVSVSVDLSALSLGAEPGAGEEEPSPSAGEDPAPFFEEGNPFASADGGGFPADDGGFVAPGDAPAAPPPTAPAEPTGRSISATRTGAPSPASPAAAPVEEGNPFASAGVPAAANGDEAFEDFVEEAPSAPAPEPQPPAKPLNRFEDVVRDCYESLRDQSRADAFKHIKFALQEASRRETSESSRYLALYAPFRDAQPWEDLVGAALAASPRERTIRLGGSEYRVRPIAYAHPTLMCDILGKDGKPLARNRRFPLEKMDPKDMYEIVAPLPVNPAPAALLSRALLTLREGSRSEFESLLRLHGGTLAPLQPFLDYRNRIKD